jgi:predicted permease
MSALADVRFALRSLRRTPGFSTVAVLTLALGIGANTAIFSATNAVLLRPLPVPDGDRLAYVTSGTADMFSFQSYTTLREDVKAFTGMAALEYGAARRDFSAAGGAVETEAVRAQAVTGNFFDVLGVRAVVGRTLNSDDDRTGAPMPAVVLSNAFWTRRFGKDAAAVGQTVRLDGIPVTVVGVMPAGFAGFEADVEPDMWWPMQLVPQLDAADPNWAARLTSGGVDWLIVFGRLQPGKTRAQAEVEATRVLRRSLQESAANPRLSPSERQKILDQRIDLRSGAAGFVSVRDQFRQPLVILMAVVCAVLMIACANVAGLLLVRGMRRKRELAVRVALGASRGRIIRHLVTESVLVSLAGGLVGLAFAYWGTMVLGSYLPANGTSISLQPDVRVMLFTGAVSLLSGLAFGAVPALRLSTFELVTEINGDDGKGGHARQRLQAVLVVAQLALSVLLLAGAGLFSRTLYNLQTIDLGYSRDNLVSFGVDAGRFRLDPRRQNEIEHRLLDVLATLPGVQSVTITGAGMLSGNGYNSRFAVDGYVPGPEEPMRASGVRAGPRFFSTIGVRLLRGREFTAADEAAPVPGGKATPPRVVILGETMARRFFGDADPVGRSIVLGQNGVRAEIVGVAGDTKYSRNLRDRTPLEFYLPFFGAGPRFSPTFYLRANAPLSALAPDIRRALAQVDARLTPKNLSTVDEAVGGLLARERLIAQLVGFFSAFAVVLASLGLFGALSYRVAQRTREIGVRVALGATLRDVVTPVLRQGLVLAVVGCSVGLVGAFGLTRLVASLLFGVTASDPLTFVAVSGLLLGVAVLASWLPARRAMRVDPIVALRSE